MSEHTLYELKGEPNIEVSLCAEGLWIGIEEKGANGVHARDRFFTKDSILKLWDDLSGRLEK